nr:histidine--tRNA ligase [Bacteroidota bacterium]
GSICGGGRYDDLTGVFGLPDVSGVGVSFGADRIYDVMMEKNLFPEETLSTTQVLFINFGKEEEKYCLHQVGKLRAAGINTEIFPEAAKLKKQLNYANNKKIPFVVLVGENEMKENVLTVKDMNSGQQTKMTINELKFRM